MLTTKDNIFYFIYLHRTGLTVTALSAVLLIWPLIESNPYNLGLSNLIAIYTMVVLGLNLFIGYAGQISLGHAAFFAIGAYGSAIGTTTLGGPAWPVMAAVALIAAIIALAVGLPALKLSGHYLAMATLGFGLIVEHMIVEWGELTGGPSGLSGVERLSVGSVNLYTPGIRYYYLVLAVVTLCIILAHNLVDSRTGRALRAIHGSEIAANTLGVDASRLKLHVFVLSAVMAALGGALYVHYLGFIAPASCGFKYSIQLVTMVVVGGMATIWGSVLGAAILTVLPQVLTFLEDYDILVYGLILILMMLFMPEGIARGIAGAARWIREKLAGIRGRPDPERGTP